MVVERWNAVFSIQDNHNIIAKEEEEEEEDNDEADDEEEEFISLCQL